MMKENAIDEVIENITSASQALSKHCHEIESFNAYSAGFIEQLSWQLMKQANELREIQYMYGS